MRTCPAKSTVSRAWCSSCPNFSLHIFMVASLQSMPCGRIVEVQHIVYRKFDTSSGDLSPLPHSTGASTLDRFIWVISFLARNDFVVIPVDQLQFDDSILAPGAR